MIIGISGKKQVGKNTVALMLKYGSSQSVREVSFAAELKNEVARTCGVTTKEIEDNKPVYRELLQAWGCYRRNKYGKDFWIDKAVKSLEQFKEDIIVFTDVRFENEAEAIKKLGGVLVRVVRATGLDDKHESETALDKYDFDNIILNSGNAAHLFHEVQDFAKKINIKLR